MRNNFVVIVYSTCWAAHRHIQLEAKGINSLRELATIRKFTAAHRDLAPAVALHYTIKPDIYGSIAARSLGVPVINSYLEAFERLAGEREARA